MLRSHSSYGLSSTHTPMAHTTSTQTRQLAHDQPDPPAIEVKPAERPGDRDLLLGALAAAVIAIARQARAADKEIGS
jgi:hypothetical protein